MRSIALFSVLAIGYYLLRSSSSSARERRTREKSTVYAAGPLAA